MDAHMGLSEQWEGLVFYYFVFLQTGTEERLQWKGVNLI